MADTDMGSHSQRFFMKDVAGSILPGGAKDFVFTFKAEKPGVFMEEWTFTGTPAVNPNPKKKT